MQSDGCPAASRSQLLDREFTLAIGFPAHCRVRSKSSLARYHFNPICNDKRGVEADPELTDQRCVLLVVSGHLLKKFGGSGTRDCAQIVDEFIARHTDAIVGDR